ncbi:MAG: alkaline phosphatase [Synergistaceae bacterium]|jgi:alkaline phosphatase|nr:alkaline phosphatase [Synergistaceae bacterium]
MRKRFIEAVCKQAFAAVFLAALFFIPASAGASAKYVFLFIGDGMGTAQRNAAELYLAGRRETDGDTLKRDAQLAMNTLPANGFIRTDSLSGITDSAASGTALATGHKTVNSAVAMNPKIGEKFSSAATIAREHGMRVGIVTSAFFEDATPAAFYGHASKRTDHYNLGIQLVESGFEYFGGGGFINPKGKDKKSRDLYEMAAANNYAITPRLDDFSSRKAISPHPKSSGGYMPWVIDKAGGPSLADFVSYGVKLLYGDRGFFMMVEGGKIDLACHANDAAAAVHETLAFDEAVSKALEFYAAKPDETLIIVTSDHETGGMTLDSRAEPGAVYGALSARQGSYAKFERKISPVKGARIGDYIAMAQKFFGPGVTPAPDVEHAFRLSMTAKNRRETLEPRYRKLYGPYDPFTMACVKASDALAGITWTTYYHTGKKVPVSAIGAGADLFSGEYENTGICDRLIAAMGD